MDPSMFLLVVLIIRAVTGHAAFRTYNRYVAVGSEVYFPPVNITNRTVYDLRITPHQLIFTYHLTWNVRPPYKQRANFLSNGTFVLRNLTKDDSRTYEQVVNMKVDARIYLYVIDPVNKPTLRQRNETLHGGRCHVFLECYVQGPDPLSMTFLKDGEELTKNITRVNRTSYLSLNTRDPSCRGTYTCKVSNPLGSKTSSEIKLLTPDDISCRHARTHWSIIIIIIIIIIGGIFIVYYKCLRINDGGDVESGDTTPQERPQPESQPRNENPPEEGRSSESSCNASVTYCEALRNNLTLNNDSEPSTAEDTEVNLDPGNCGEEEETTMNLEAHGTTSDHRQEANG